MNLSNTDHKDIYSYSQVHKPTMLTPMTLLDVIGFWVPKRHQGGDVNQPACRQLQSVQQHRRNITSFSSSSFCFFSLHCSHLLRILHYNYHQSGSFTTNDDNDNDDYNLLLSGPLAPSRPCVWISRLFGEATSSSDDSSTQHHSVFLDISSFGSFRRPTSFGS